MTTFTKPLLKRIKLLPRDKERYVEYDMWRCPRCKYMQFNKHKNCIGICHSWHTLVLDTGRYGLLYSIPTHCSRWDLGKFKPAKRKEIKRAKPTTRVRKVLSR